ncbi:hypothetical protein AGR8A_Cc30753 [Agrobacterium fabrum str. J-07]|nr:hypothetical protein AGR8A_Cc30753 [Agrobacterium fabrum str. J-07]
MISPHVAKATKTLCVLTVEAMICRLKKPFKRLTSSESEIQELQLWVLLVCGIGSSCW